MGWLVVIVLCVICLIFYCIRTSPQGSDLGKKIAHNKNYREAWRIFDHLSSLFLNNLSENYKEGLENSLIHRPYPYDPKKYDFINIEHSIYQNTAELLNSTVKNEYDGAKKELTQHGFLCLEALIRIIWLDSNTTNYTPEVSDKLSNKILSRLCSDAPDGYGADNNNLIAWKIYMGSCLHNTPYNKMFFNGTTDEPSKEKVFAYIESQYPRNLIGIDYDSFLEYTFNKIKSYLDEIQANKKAKLKSKDPFIKY